MTATEDNGRPTIIISGIDEFGEPKTVAHSMDIDSAKKLRDELTDAINRCMVMGAEFSLSNSNSENTKK